MYSQGHSQSNIMTEAKSMKKWWLRQCPRFNLLPGYLGCLWWLQTTKKAKKNTEASVLVCLLLAKALLVHIIYICSFTIDPNGTLTLIWTPSHRLALLFSEYLLMHFPKCHTTKGPLERGSGSPTSGRSHITPPHLEELLCSLPRHWFHCHL